MVSKEFYLVIESSWFTYCYLVDTWLKILGDFSNFKGIIAIEKPGSERLHAEREAFHREYAGRTQLNEDMRNSLHKLYPGFEEPEKAMIHLFGIPKYSTSSYAKTIYFFDVNGEAAKQWLTAACQTDSRPYFFIGIGKILKPWWIEMSHGQIINAHSAVLPYARGLNAIENIAAVKDIQKFKQSVGATVHYVDAGVDTGAIIRAKRVVNPFRFNSLWELKGYLYLTGFQLLADVAKDITSTQETIPVGIMPDRNSMGPNFKQKDFTGYKRQQAEKGYLLMKSQNP